MPLLTYEFEPFRIALDGLDRYIQTLSVQARNGVVDILDTPPKTGIFYGKHRASAAGQSPASDTGALRNSIESDFLGRTVTVKASVDYAGYLEFGTRKMAARPFMLRGVDLGIERTNADLSGIFKVRVISD